MKEWMKSLESQEMFEQLCESDRIHVFVFSANWCPDCMFIRPFMPELIEKFSEFTFVYVDRDKFIDLCIDHEIMGIPSFVAYKNNHEIGRFVNKFRKSKEEINQFLEKLK